MAITVPLDNVLTSRGRFSPASVEDLQAFTSHRFTSVPASSCPCFVIFWCTEAWPCSAVTGVVVRNGNFVLLNLSMIPEPPISNYGSVIGTSAPISPADSVAWRLPKPSYDSHMARFVRRPLSLTRRILKDRGDQHTLCDHTCR